MWRSTLIGLGLSLVLAASAGCHAELGDPGAGGDGGQRPDGGGGNGDAPGGNPDAAIDAPACFNGRVVYLNFDGVALTDAATSDATLNRASWMNTATGTAPAFRAASATRLTDIQTITTGVRTQLSQFPVTVVTTRPAAGPYVMIVFGGTAAQVGSAYGLAVNELDCGDATRSDVAWIGDATGSPLQRLINTAVGAIGFGLGLTATTSVTDCMCGWANGCTSNNTVACTLSPSIPRDPAATQLCAGLTTQNEVQTFTQAFCQ